jgi:hypothetical protein
VSNATIALELDHGLSDAARQLGGKVSLTRGQLLSGLVRIDAESPIKSRGVDVILRWQTSGKGTTTSHDAGSIRILQGPVPAGRSEIPFRLDVPLAPLTYMGTLLKIQWTLRVRIDRPWAIDQVEDQVVLLT